MKKRLLVTGSSGMLGKALCNRFKDDYELYATDITESETPSFNKLDVTSQADVTGIVKQIKPDIVIHAAAYTDVDGCETSEEKAFKVNTDGARNVALALRDLGGILLYISTDYVFDGKKKKPYTEDDQPNPINVYGNSKLEGERAVQEVLNKYVVIRSSWLYGGGGKNFVDTINKQPFYKEGLKVVSDQVGSPTYTSDLADGVFRLVRCALDRTIEKIYHVTNSGRVSWYDFAKMILKYADIKNASILSVSSEESDRVALRPRMSALDNRRYQKTTGHKLRSFEEALKEYISERRV